MKRGPSKRLTMLERRVLVKAFAKEYHRGRKKDKGAILNGFVEVTGSQRRYAERLLRHSSRRVWVGRGVLVNRLPWSILKISSLLLL